MSKLIKTSFIVVALLAAVAHQVQSNPTQIMTSATANILQPAGNHVYDYANLPYKRPTNSYQNHLNLQQQVVMPQQVVQQVPSVVQQVPVIQQQVPVAQVPASRVDDLLKQVHDLKRQLPATKQDSSVNVNNHVSKVSIGNQKETNINNISNSVAPITSKSITSQDVGPKSTHIGNQQAAYHQSPVTTMNGDGNYLHYGQPQKVKTHPTEEQKELKARLLALASKATANAPSEPVLRYNPLTGVLEKIPVDPNANVYKDKLHRALEMLNPKKLPTNKLKRVLEGTPAHSVNPYEQIIIQHPTHEVLLPPPEPSEFVEESAPVEEYPLEQVPTREDVVNQVRFELDDRLNRISDLLYFRPEFMNQLLQMDDGSELTPVESEFKRMVLCNSDEQFCSQGSAAIGHHLQPEEQQPAEPVLLEEEPEVLPEPSYHSHHDDDLEDDLHHHDDDLVDDSASSHGDDDDDGDRKPAQRGQPQHLRQHHNQNNNYHQFDSRSTERARNVRRPSLERRNSHHAEPKQQSQHQQWAPTSNSRYQQPQLQQQRLPSQPHLINNGGQQRGGSTYGGQQQNQVRVAPNSMRGQPQQQQQQMHQIQPSYQQQQQQRQPMRLPTRLDGNARQTLPSSKSG